MIPVMGTVSEGGRVNLPEGFLDVLESHMENEHGKQIYPTCPKCKQAKITREKWWKGACHACLGIKPEPQPMDLLPTVSADDETTRQIRERLSQDEGLMNMLNVHGNGDIRTVSILQTPQKREPAVHYLYRSKENIIFAVVDADFNLLYTMKLYR